MILVEIFEEVVTNNPTWRAFTVQGIRHKTEILFQIILAVYVAHEDHEAVYDVVIDSSSVKGVIASLIGIALHRSKDDL